ncbi:hypothetical protein BD310DRAFT_878729 [Dichomitus squalens]|uniref:AAA+ ATPase domain-containing protein n=1 Tax=Dichomitus squalens TaxID=114155 RepID=A0A4Q9PVB5_9APHY|nr:hypothetical protein BD310DRAFT_878729 [Dichomitus squalens]
MTISKKASIKGFLQSLMCNAVSSHQALPDDGGPLAKASSFESRDVAEDSLSVASTAFMPLAGQPHVHYIEERFDSVTKKWEKHQGCPDKLPVEDIMHSGYAKTSDPIHDVPKGTYLTLIKRLPDPSTGDKTPTYTISINHPYLKTACRTIMGHIPWLKWDELFPATLFVQLLPRFLEHEASLLSRSRTDEEDHELVALQVLVDLVRKEYSKTLTAIRTLTDTRNITFELLWTIFVPMEIAITKCPYTSEPYAVRIRTSDYLKTDSAERCYHLSCEFIELRSLDDGRENEDGMGGFRSREWYGYSRWDEYIASTTFFGDGEKKITDLPIYPLRFHPDAENLKKTLVERGRKWASLCGAHGYKHAHYKGVAVGHEKSAQRRNVPGTYRLDSRVVIDKARFARTQPVRDVPHPGRSLDSYAPIYQDADGDYEMTHMIEEREPVTELPLSDDELLLTPAIVYGFSFEEKRWLRLDVRNFAEIEWAQRALDTLLIPGKELLRSHLDINRESSLRGERKGLVSVLHGPSGVGKTFCVKAVSEYLQRPLYRVDSADLFTSWDEFDAVADTFNDAARWNAILVIDGADFSLVPLKGATPDLSIAVGQRDAVTTMITRMLDKHRGVVFFTTRSAPLFDEGLRSRIRLPLAFPALTSETRGRIWHACLENHGVSGNVAESLVEKLASRNVNGHQIENICDTAVALARFREEAVGYEHFDESLKQVEAFSAFLQSK